MNPTKLAYIAIFGLIGIFSRFFIDQWVARTWPRGFYPLLGTLAINLTGCLIAGLVYAVGVEKLSISEELQRGLLVGFAGGFTTFSAYCLQTVLIFETGNLLASLLYLSLSPILGVGFVGLGLYFGKAI